MKIDEVKTINAVSSTMLKGNYKAFSKTAVLRIAKALLKLSQVLFDLSFLHTSLLDVLPLSCTMTQNTALSQLCYLVL